MKGFALIAILITVFDLACNSKTSYVQSVDDLIIKRSPYQDAYAFKRFRLYWYKIDSSGTFGPDHKITWAIAGYDSLTRKMTLISYVYFKNSKSSIGRSDQLDFDENGSTIRIQILTHDYVQPQDQHHASYYFKNDSLVQQSTYNIRIKDLSYYLKAADSIKVLLLKIIN